MNEIRPGERVDHPINTGDDAPGLRFEKEIDELALALAGVPDAECVETLKRVSEDLRGPVALILAGASDAECAARSEDLRDTDLAINFLIAVLKRKFEIEKITMTSRFQ